MKHWLRKISVIIITIMTLGIYIPPAFVTTNAEKNDESVAVNSNINEELVNSITESETESPNILQKTEQTIHPKDTIIEKAKEQVLTKLGPKIAKEVESEFTSTILPNMEEVLNILFDNMNEEEVIYYHITEQPTSGLGERIFNIYDYRTGKDIALFHVRRDNRPLEGYWFNFHYHLSDDEFEEHHDIGEIYWDKNVPPKWMS